MKNIATAFIKAKREFSPALKDKTNPAFRSKYADLGACIEAVNDALLANGIALTQKTHPDETGITVETILMHESGETLSGGVLHVPASKQDPQGYGSALSYARRYSLMATCGIAPEDDDGNAAVKAVEHRKTAGFTDNPKRDVFGTLQPEIQDALRKAAPQIDAAIPDVTKAIELASMALDNWPDEDRSDLKMGLWHLLSSKTRTAIDRREKQ